MLWRGKYIIVRGFAQKEILKYNKMLKTQIAQEMDAFVNAASKSIQQRFEVGRQIDRQIARQVGRQIDRQIDR